MDIKIVSLNDYLNMTEEYKIQFYKKIVQDNPKTKISTEYITNLSPAKQAKIPDFQFHQINGYLTYIAPLKRKDKEISSLFFLTICDCGNWHILEANSFRKEKQIFCYNCSKNNLTTMKDISGEIYGQLQALYPLSKRAKDGSVFWQCQCVDCGNLQEIPKYNLRKDKGHLCSCCGEKSKGEFKVASLLKENNISFEREKTFPNCKFKDSLSYARFDFFVDNSYIIEIDGQHHFFPVKYGSNITDDQVKELYKKVIEHDRFKNEYCFKNNIPIIRIPYMSIKDLTYDDLVIEKSKFLLYNNI